MNAKKVEKTITIQDLLEAKGDTLISKLSYEDGVALAEELLQNVEMGNLPLEQSIVSYEKGMMLLKHLQSKLNEAEERLKLLSEKDGEIVVEEV